jgi:hypothetical protein
MYFVYRLVYSFESHTLEKLYENDFGDGPTRRRMCEDNTRVATNFNQRDFE